MIFQLDLQNCRLSSSTRDYLGYQVKRIERYLPAFARDLPKLHLFLEGHPTREYFEGSLVLFLPKQTLNVHFKSRSLDRAIKLAFTKLRRELSNYKGRHFVGQSEYPKREATFREEG